MYCIVQSAVTHGITSHIIQVEVDISDGMPSFSMVGYLSNEVREAADRVRTAIKNSGIKLPIKKITVNLSPADLRKEGSTLDLPIAVSILSALGYATQASLEGILFVGELSLSGQINPISGVLPIVSKAKEKGFHTCIVPKENAREGGILEGIDVVGVNTLEEMISYLNDPYRFEPEYVSYEELLSEDKKQNQIDFSEIKGQKAVKRATEIAVAGFHNLMFIGPPGSGKTMIAKRIPTILPPLTLEESIELSKVYSVLGMLPVDRPLITRRPFRDPHHTVTPIALAGGGRRAKPGEISMAHKGILFLDEFPEFSKGTLEILRQPLEEGLIHIARNYGNYTYPANIMLVAAMNPCNCGYYPDFNKCSCTSASIQRYLGKISQPLLDRIDICVEAPVVSLEDMKVRETEESSKTIGMRVIKAHKRQTKRYQGTAFQFNNDLTSSGIEKYCILGQKEEELMGIFYKKWNLSLRSYHKILKVARTIADLAEEEQITAKHLTEAACYRTLDKKYWK